MFVQSPIAQMIVEANNCKADVASNRGWHAVRIAVALLLLTASGLKCWQLATEPILRTSWLDSRWLLMATVEFELLFGLWLFAGISARPTWAAALACFGLFSCVSLCKAISGQSTCGCFGRMVVHPWYTTGLDVMVVASLLRWRPIRQDLSFVLQFKDVFRRAAVVLTIWLLAGVPAGFVMGSYTDTTLSDAGEIIVDGKTVVLEPEKWIGKRFPLLDYIDIGDRLKEGKWKVLLYHRACPRCATVMDRLLQTDSKHAAWRQLALIEMPPHSRDKDTTVEGKQIVAYGRVADSNSWFAETPIVLHLQAGGVKGVELANVLTQETSSNAEVACTPHSPVQQQQD